MTPAEELRTAAEKMRSFPGPAAAPIADWLDSVARRISLDGADWTGPDRRHGLAVARAINGTPPPTP